MSRYAKAIVEINPNAEVIIEIPNGETETYEMIQWVQPDQQIDQATLDAKVTEIENRDAYIVPRQNSYPSVQDQLDMMFHDKKNNTTTWEDAIQAVKDAQPKTSEE